jgi:hypothetical protein
MSTASTFGAFQAIDTAGAVLNNTTTTPFIYSPVVFGRYVLDTTGPADSVVPVVNPTSGATALPVGAAYPSVGR